MLKALSECKNVVKHPWVTRQNALTNILQLMTPDMELICSNEAAIVTTAMSQMQ